MAAAQRVAAVHSATVAERLQQRGCCGGRSAVVVRSATLQRQRHNQSTAMAHSATAAARWEQRRGCGGFTGTIREWANASAFECHRLTDIRVFVLG